MNNSLTIVIPVFNEENSVKTTIKLVFSLAKKSLSAFEIFVVDDGSSDKSLEIAQKTARALGPEVEVIPMEINVGVGSVFSLSLQRARFPYISLIPGDNAYHQVGIERLFSAVGASPLIISYRKDMSGRKKFRMILSKIATAYVSLLSGKKIRDAHSLFVFPVNQLKGLKINNAGYGYHMECLIRLLRLCPHYKEVEVALNPRPDDSSGVIRGSVLFKLSITMLKLIFLRLTHRL